MRARAVAAALTAVLVPATPAAPAASAEPVAAEGRPYLYLEGPPGTVLQDTLSLTNPGRRPLTLRLRATAPWVAFAANPVTVPPRTRADVPFSVTVPPDTPPGDHTGALLAKGGTGGDVTVPVRLRVGGPRLAALTVEDVRITGEAIHYTLVNRGNTVLEPRLAVRAEGLLGEVLHRPERPLRLELRPGRRVGLSEPWAGRDRPALDRVTVRLDATAGDGTRAGAEATGTFGTRWAGGASAAAVAAAGAVTWRTRRRGRGARGADG
ncbi:hypothetical protein E2C00_09075 [Streptomyces sp. WAC05374]|uniref:COG1470 family protein n=2 Tax=Streptomyces sp. WAC05374 TaxID=2487420 RepID=UPI0010558CDC|nr:hypothetical protein [Streptomyces sp. WAC05374]TDF46965.1 hypothetical protein E2B92_07905 [Streptomyces sp. WAC05374]TDF57220.1 hypothetical protein E2C00_09075 [Streptomyces sp. WAC05374]TDF61323.1 hypothetical protein E2C02_00265 [Streptomyces sp. WAC05374]